jgi:DNA (cytosine-5)-methyltransferase 1
MPSFGECPSEENVSRLSAILEECPHPKYSLSAKACQGILNRAERRGKELPKALKEALEAQSLFKNEQESQGGGKGILIQNERTGALSTLNNQSVFCLQGNGIDRAIYTVDQGGGKSGANIYKNISPTLACTHGGEPAVCYGIGGYNSKGMLSDNPKAGIYEAGTSRTLDLNGGSPACNQGGIAVVQTSPKVTGPLMANSHPGSYTGQDAYNDMFVTSFAAGGFGKYEEGVGTLKASGGDYGGGTETLVKTETVRRLTPTECERLQGYPDGWTDIGEWVDSKGKKHKEADSPRYKALGNSIALPFWKWLLKRISAQYERDATLGSLFDGIGGFPLCWEQINGKGSTRWASEIEEFPMAVTRKRFGE